MKTAFKNYLHELTKVQHVFLVMGRGKGTNTQHFIFSSLKRWNSRVEPWWIWEVWVTWRLNWSAAACCKRLQKVKGQQGCCWFGDCAGTWASMLQCQPGACSLLRMHSSPLELGCMCACWLHPFLPSAPHPDQTFLVQYLDKKLLNCGRVGWTAAAALLFSCFTNQKNVI